MDERVHLSDEGAAMVQELNYGHNALNYFCSQRPTEEPFDSEAVCIHCSDGFEAMAWQRRALRAEAELARLRGEQG